jgi:ribonuclease T1
MLRAALAVSLAITIVSAALPPAQARESAVSSIENVALQKLPDEALRTLTLIKQGGPFPYAKDGVVFSNREKILPSRARGYYTEYTVKTPGSRDRGARRIVAGGDPRGQAEFFYTGDHYQSFKRIRE